MTTITKERLLTIRQWRETYGPGSNVVLPAEEAEELARIALAALEVEPIGFRCRRNDNLGDWSYVYHREPDDFERKHLVIEGIYAAPPAPVPLTEVQRAMLRDMDVEISAELEEEEEIYRDGIRKCIAALRYHHKRAETCSNGYTGSTLEEDTLKSINFLKRNNIAAMLQGAKPVSQTYNLPELIEGMEVSIDVSTCDADLGNRYFGTVTEALELDTAKNGYILLVQDAEPNFDINGNSPVTPDGWISCSERMPEETGDIIVVSDGIVMSGISYSRRDGFYIAALKYDDDEPIGGVTHWMPLPEPPQGVNDELA
ncbi:prophage protein [Escherichia coli]|nr:prophage protein [Escherichia coli]